MRAKSIDSYENGTSNVHENFSLEYTGSLSRHFNIHGAYPYLYWGTNFVFFILTMFLWIHKYNIYDFSLTFRNSKISLSLLGINRQHQYSTLSISISISHPFHRSKEFIKTI